MKTILMHTPNALDGVSIYRHWGPMLRLEKTGEVKTIAFPEQPEAICNWQYYFKSDLAFVQRGFRLIDRAFVEECTKHCLPIWLDMDDNLFCLPDDNPVYGNFGPHAQQNILKILKMADFVSVATSPLKKFLKEQHGIESTIVPNALDDFFIRFQKPFQHSNKVLWRGSPGGQAALQFYSPALLDIASKKKHLDWTILGLSPWFLNRFTNNHPFKWRQAQNFISYVPYICELNPSITFMTHLDHEFDRTKSTNGWLESTLAGSACLVPNVGQWAELPDNCVVKYDIMNLKDFESKFLMMIEMNTEKNPKIKEMVVNSWKLISNEFLLSKINKQRLEIVKELTRGNYGGKKGISGLVHSEGQHTFLKEQRSLQEQ